MQGPSSKNKLPTSTKIEVKLKNLEIQSKLPRIVSTNNGKFLEAIKKNDKETCQKILNEALDKNPKDVFGRTALHDCVNLGKTEIFKMIMDKVEIKNPKDHIDGITPLHEAARVGNAKISR